MYIRPLTGTCLLVICWSREIQRQVMTPPSAAVNGQIKKNEKKRNRKRKRSQVANDGNLEGKSSIRCRARSEVYSSARWSLWLSLHFETEAPPQIRGVALLHPCCCCWFQSFFRTFLLLLFIPEVFMSAVGGRHTACASQFFRKKRREEKKTDCFLVLLHQDEPQRADLSRRWCLFHPFPHRERALLPNLIWRD